MTEYETLAKECFDPKNAKCLRDVIRNWLEANSSGKGWTVNEIAFNVFGIEPHDKRRKARVHTAAWWLILNRADVERACTGRNGAWHYRYLPDQEYKDRVDQESERKRKEALAELLIEYFKTLDMGARVEYRDWTRVSIDADELRAFLVRRLPHDSFVETDGGRC